MVGSSGAEGYGVRRSGLSSPGGDSSLGVRSSDPGGEEASGGTVSSGGVIGASGVVPLRTSPGVPRSETSPSSCAAGLAVRAPALVRAEHGIEEVHVGVYRLLGEQLGGLLLLALLLD